MSFLAPLFLLGAVTIIAPILFHLIRRTTKDKVLISSLMFLQPSPPRVTRRSRIENWLLLLLRCLVIGLLALGFARPFFDEPLTAGNNQSTGQRVLFLVDTSASMKRDGFWETLISQLRDELEGIDSGDQAALYVFGGNEQVVMGFDEWEQLPVGERPMLMTARARELTPGWSATQLGPAIINAVEILEEREKAETFPRRKRIIVLSDFQEGSHLEGLQGYSWPRNLEVEMRTVASASRVNAGLQLLSDREPVRQGTTNQQRMVAARISNASDSTREQFQIYWSDPRTGGPISEYTDVYVPPGQSRIVKVVLPPSLGKAARLSLNGDEESFDNHAYFVPPTFEAIPLLFLSHDISDNPEGMLYYLKRAFQDPAVGGVEVVAHAIGEPLTVQEFEDLPLIVGSGNINEDLLTPLRAFLQNGQTLLWVLDSVSGLNTVASLLDAEAISAQEKDVHEYAMLGKIDFTHPLFAPFADPRFNDFTKIHFWKYRHFAAEGLPPVRVLANFDDGSPALMEFSLGRGHLFVLASSWRPSDSQFALSSKFVPFIYSLLDYAGAFPSDSSSYVVDEKVLLTMDDESPVLTVVKPDGTEVEVQSETIFSDTDEPGIYTMRSANSAVPFAVNIDPDESRTATLSVDALESLGIPLSMDSALGVEESMADLRRLKATELEGQQKMWRWVLMLALICLVLETWLSGRLSRKPVVTPKPA